MDFYTVGVYGSTEQSFFDKLIDNQIDTFCDIRQRRGVRGSKYAYVNSKYLQAKLEKLGIRYVYIPELAPSGEIRELQKLADKQANVLKSERKEISKVFEIAYRHRILSRFDFDSFFKQLQQLSSHKIAFFCVEECAQACHRSLVTNTLKNQYNCNVKHL